MAAYPPPESRSRAVLVRNISHIATSAAIEQFFSFCGPITEHKIRAIPPRTGNEPTLEAVVIFADSQTCEDALVMTGSAIVDQPVTISRIPSDYDFNIPPPDTPPPQPQGLFGGFAAFGDLFAGVGTAVAAEVDKASRAIDSATDSGVLKAAKDQVALAHQKTRDFAADLDDKWHVRNSILNTVETGKAKATQVASVVAEQTTKVATDLDSRLHISENTGKLADRARQNEAVNSGIMAVQGGWQTLMAQTGLGDSPTTTAQNGNVNVHPEQANGSGTETNASRTQ